MPLDPDVDKIQLTIGALFCLKDELMYTRGVKYVDQSNFTIWMKWV